MLVAPICTFSSARENPRPARTRRLYLIVGQRTTGLNLSTGRGATLMAFSLRALRRRCFRPGCVAEQLSAGSLRGALQAPLLSAGLAREGIYLVEMHSDAPLPILAEMVVLNLLIVLDGLTQAVSTHTLRNL